MPIHAEASPVARDGDLLRGPQQALRVQVPSSRLSAGPARETGTRFTCWNTYKHRMSRGSGKYRLSCARYRLRVQIRYLIVQARRSGSGTFCPIDVAYRQLPTGRLSITIMQFPDAMQL